MRKIVFSFDCTQILHAPQVQCRPHTLRNKTFALGIFPEVQFDCRVTHWARSIVRRLIRRRIRLILFPLDSEQFQPPAVRRVSRDFWRLIVEPRWRLKEAKGKLWHFLTKYSCFCCVKWQEFAEYKKCVENCTFFHRKCTKIQHF